MKKPFLLFSIVLLMALLPVSVQFAQDQQTTKHNNLKLAFEFGMNAVGVQLEKPEQIRENRSSGYIYMDEYYEYGFFTEANTIITKYIGVKPEFFIYKNLIGIASGIRFTMVSSDLVSDRNIFLWKVKEEGLNTEYVRIMDISNKSYLLGIPLEVRFFPKRKELPFQHYVKLGASFNFRFHSENNINFRNKAMEKNYDDLIKKQLPKNKLFSSFIFAATGFKIGKFKEGKMIPWGNIEFQFPYILLTDKSFAFAGNSFDDVGFPGVGFQISFQIPIGKNVPIGSN